MKKLALTFALALLLVGGGCKKSEQPPAASAPKSSDATPEEIAELSMSTFTHQKFGFSFSVPTELAFTTDVKYAENGNDILVTDKKFGDVRLNIIVQPGIPGVPLAPEKIEKLNVGGVHGHLYHDTDPADGGNVDRLIVDFPNGKNTVYIATPELPNQPMMNLKEIAKTWKWKK